MSDAFATPPTAAEIAAAGFDTPPTQDEVSAAATDHATPQSEPVSLTAYKAARGPAPAQAAEALSLAAKSGKSPQFVSDNLDAVRAADQQRTLADALAGMPYVAEYAAQSPVHAAAVKDDVGVLRKLADAFEMGATDVGYGFLAQEYMSKEHPAPWVSRGVNTLEQDIADYGAQDHGILEEVVRAVPSIGLYGAAAAAGGPVGLGAALYMQNRGVLYRRIWANAPVESPDFDPVAFDKSAKEISMKASTVAATIGASLGMPFTRALPGASAAMREIGTDVVAKAVTETASRSIIHRLLEWGGHTLSGALMMASQAVTDDAAVQKATTGTIDYGKAVTAGGEALPKALEVAGVLSVYSPGRGLLRDLGRIHDAAPAAARLDKMVDAAKGLKLPPEQAEPLLAKMAAAGDASTVYIDGEAAKRPEIVQKLVETLADEGRALAEAQATGGDVAVPVEKYLTGMQDEHAALREDVKLDPEGATPRQADELQKSLAQLLAERQQVKNEPDSPERRQQLQAVHEKMRDAVLERYGGTPEDWARVLTPQMVDMVQAALNPLPREVPPPADSMAWARKLSNEATIAELQPGRYELAARRAEDKLAAIAKEAAQKGTGAAEQAFVGAGMQAAGSEQTPAAGKENLAAAGKKAGKAQKLLAEVPALEQARDLARAQAKEHADVKAEIDRSRDYLRKRDTDQFRADLAKADPAYLGAFDTILDAIDENTPRAPANPGALDLLLERMDRDAESLGFDPDALRSVLTGSKGWPKLTPPEARNVLDAVKTIRSAARRQNEIALADRKANLRDRVTELRTYLDEHNTPDTGLPAPSRASQGPLDKLAAGAHAIHAEMLQPLRILRDRLGPLGNDIADTYVKARGVKEELARQVGDEVYRFYELNLPKELKKSRFDGVEGPGSPVFADDKWTRQDLWEFASWWGSESGSDRIKRGLRITDGQAHEFMSQLTNAEADFLDAKWKLNDEKLWPLIRDHQREVTGAAPPKIEAMPFTIRTAEGDIRELRGGYEPARYRKDAESTVPAPENAQTISDYWGSLREGFDSTPRYFIKERAQNVARVPDLNWSAYAGHVGSVLHFLAYDDFVRNVGRIFRDQEFRDLVQRRLGPQEMQELDKFLGVTARGRVELPTDGANRLSNLLGSGFRSRVATAAFQLNPRIVLGQFSHLPAAAAALKIGPQDMLYGLSQAMRPSSWGEAFDVSQQLPYRWNGYGAKMREMLTGIGPGDKPLTRKWLDAAGWSAYHAMDGFLSKAIYEAGASKAERAGASPAEAVKAGDRAVELMMPPLNLAEQSSFARDKGVVGSLILVRNFPNTLYNVGAMLEWNARNQVHAADPGWQKAMTALGAYGAAGASYLGTVWAAHILGRFLMGHGRQPDEHTSEWLEREALSAPFYPVPLVSDVAGAVAEASVTHKTLKQSIQHHGIAAAPAIAEVERAIRDLATAVGHGPSEERVFAGLRLAANALNLPSEPLRGIQYGVDLYGRRVRPRGPFDVAGGFLYGQRRGGRQARNPATVTQDILTGR